MVGGIDSKTGRAANNFTDAQFNSLRTLIDMLKVTYKDAVVQGHRDFPNVKKDCPCFDTKKWFAS